MATGRVKWFDNRKGFGFIAQEGGDDVFVHYTSIAGEGFRTLADGEAVEFDLVSGPKGPSAQRVTRAPEPAPRSGGAEVRPQPPRDLEANVSG